MFESLIVGEKHSLAVFQKGVHASLHFLTKLESTKPAL
jgi:hypothetical protein